MANTTEKRKSACGSPSLPHSLQDTHGAACGCGSQAHAQKTKHAHEHTHEHREHAHEHAFSPVLLLIGIGLFALSFLPFWPDFGGPLLCSAAAALVLLPVVRESFEEWRAFSLGEHSLLVIAVIAALCIGEFPEAALVALLFAVGEWLEARAVRRSEKQIEALAQIRPDTALRLTDGQKPQQIPADDIQPGDRLLVPPYQRMAADGVVEEGRSSLDTSALTGESAPREVGVGDTVLSGSVNGPGELVIRAQKPAGQSTAARILALVSDAGAHKGRAEKFMTRFARIYTPLVLAAAILLAVVPPLCGWGRFTDYLYRALTLLVAACPCALVISIPLGFFAGIGAASKQGVLIKGGQFVEALAAARAIAFDKTGTLTTDRPEVSRLTTAPGIDALEACALAAAAERYSQHPTALAVTAFAKQEGAPVFEASEVKELPALGVEAVVQGRKILCGGRRLMKQKGVDLAGLPDSEVFLAVDGAAQAGFSLRFALREDAAETVARLRSQGFAQVVMLTGDREAPAREIAFLAGIDEVRAGLLPEEKLTAVAALQKTAGKTLFVGDGINDAPVLAAADAGIAMGLGSAAAIETADAVLSANRLIDLPAAVRLCRRVMRVVRFNIVFALTVKAAVLLLAGLGLAPMWAAVFADVGVSALSILNAARLLSARSAAPAPGTAWPAGCTRQTPADS